VISPVESWSGGFEGWCEEEGYREFEKREKKREREREREKEREREMKRIL